MENLCALVGAGAIAFYWAEKDHNPEVRSYWDAVHYIATCLSVGYAKIFPVTPMGKAIGAAVMMVGPALSAGALGGAKETPALPGPSDPVVVGRLDEILVELRKLNAARES
ncbi:MAG TPA: potassium channel family protein [Polyangiaceae bacterium]